LVGELPQERDRRPLFVLVGPGLGERQDNRAPPGAIRARSRLELRRAEDALRANEDPFSRSAPHRGIPVIVVSKILGHSKPGITMDIYGHMYNVMQDEAAQLMDEIVTPVQIELSEDRVIARSRQATKQSPHD
jgi:hypothetical protein